MAHSIAPPSPYFVVHVCPPFCQLQFAESGVNVFDCLHSVTTPLGASMLKFAFCRV